MSAITELDELVVAAEIGERLGVQRRSVHMWRHRGNGFPEPAQYAGTVPQWKWGDVLGWAGRTGHIRTAHYRLKYKAAFGQEPAEPRRGGRIAEAAGLDDE